MKKILLTLCLLALLTNISIMGMKPKIELKDFQPSKKCSLIAYYVGANHPLMQQGFRYYSFKENREKMLPKQPAILFTIEKIGQGKYEKPNQDISLEIIMLLEEPFRIFCLYKAGDSVMIAAGGEGKIGIYEIIEGEIIINKKIRSYIETCIKILKEKKQDIMKAEGEKLKFEVELDDKFKLKSIIPKAVSPAEEKFEFLKKKMPGTPAVLVPRQ